LTSTNQIAALAIAAAPSMSILNIGMDNFSRRNLPSRLYYLFVGGPEKWLVRAADLAKVDARTVQSGP
jgi:hypothetical protein